MKNVMKYQMLLDKMSEVSSLLSDEAQAELKAKSEEFMNEMQDSQYIKVPLVGVFSAGKSSLLNVFTQKNNMHTFLHVATNAKSSTNTDSSNSPPEKHSRQL